MDQMIDVISSSVKAQSDSVNKFGGVNQVQFLVDTLQILQYVLKQGHDSQMEKLFASNELDFLIQHVVIRYKSQQVRMRAAELVLKMSEKKNIFLVYSIYCILRWKKLIVTLVPAHNFSTCSRNYQIR